MRRLPSSLALLSVALIGFQLVLMQLLSIVQWHHFAYMVISVALLGFGASGTAISLAREWFLRWFDLVVPASMFVCGAAMPLATAVSQFDAARFDSYVVLVEAAQFGSLLFTYLILFIPFFFGAVAVGLILVRYAKVAGSFYFANLVGSGLGAVLALAAMWFVRPTSLPGITGIVAVLAGILIIPRRYRLWLAPAGMTALLACTYLSAYPPDLVRSQYKDLSKTLDLPDAVIETEEASPYGLVQVVSAPSIRYAPGLSLTYRGDIPVQSAVFNNGNWYGPIPAWQRDDSTHLLDYSTRALPYVLHDRRDVLILSAGTGDDAAHALANGADDVAAVEPHAAVLSLIADRYAPESDSLLHHRALTVRAMEPRTYLAGSDEIFDLISLPTVGSFGGSVGLFAMQEQYSLTIQAFREMWDHLTPNGAIAFTVWMDHPYRNPLKAVATLAATLRESGIVRIRDHLVALRSWGTMTLVATRSPVDSLVAGRVRSFADRMSFDPVLLPDIRSEERMQYNALQDTSFFSYVDRILDGDSAFMQAYAFDIRPATDNRPYFSQFLRWKTLPQLADELGPASLPFIELGTLIAGATVLQIFIAALLLIILPLTKLGWSGSGKAWTFVYFAGLGIGFMFIEMVLIQRFVLYLGHPIFATSAVLGSILIFSGIGSRLSELVQVRRGALGGVAALVSIFVLVYAFTLTPVIRATIGIPLAGKALLAIPMIGVPAVLMGMPFPMGLRHLARRHRDHIPWAWAINGSLSVMSTALAALLAVHLGFFTVMLIAAAAYALVSVMSLLRA